MKQKNHKKELGKLQKKVNSEKIRKESIGMFTKNELELLRGLVNLSLRNTEGMIRNLERKQQEKTITDKQKKMLKAFQESSQFKQNLLKKLEGVTEND